VTGTYQWTINGETTSSAQNLSFGTAGRAAGSYTAAVTVNAQGYNPGTGSTSVTVRPYRPPTGTVSATPNDLTVGDKALINSSFRNECDGIVHAATYTASEGSVSGNTYDSSTVQFDASNRGDQSKTVTITATATDDRSSGTATTTVVVHKPANKEATRLPDLVFARNNARVNNCGKRLLLEQLKTYLDQDPTGKVVFVGHTDNRETRGLDERRALNAAAIISAGKGICLNFNAGQILVGAEGTNQGNVDFQPYFCGTSASPKTTEKAGQAVNASDKRAQYRRVEVWFVPTNGNLPASGGSAKDATSLGVSKLGCPR
jgi:outer membrane protein OmpA-like peptidoglycan-associated protein